MNNRKSSLLVLAMVLSLFALPGTSFGAMHLFLRATGVSQGVIQGDATLPGYENAINIYSLQHSVGIPSGANGIPSGPPSVSELTITTAFDPSTVRMFQALANQEQFTNFNLELVEDGLGKMPMVRVRYELTGAYVTGGSQSSGGGLPSVSLSFSYSVITISDISEGTSVTYYWTPPTTTTPGDLSKGFLLAPTPNPTHGQAEFRFTLPADSNADLTLYDLRGYQVRQLHSGWTSSESTVAVWDGTDDSGVRVAQGMYLARLTYPGFEFTQRITVLR